MGAFTEIENLFVRAGWIRAFLALGKFRFAVIREFQFYTNRKGTTTIWCYMIKYSNSLCYMLVAPIDLAISTANKRLGELFDILFHCTANKETNIFYSVYYHGIKMSILEVAEDGMFQAKGMRKHNLYFF